MRSAPQVPSLALASAAAACLAASGAWALDAASLEKLGTGDASAKVSAIQEAVASADVAALPILRALLEGRLSTAGGRVLLEESGALVDPLTRRPAGVAVEEAERVTINNRLRRTLERAVAALELFSPAA